MNHSYEEIRDACLDVISGREKTSWGFGQYENLRQSVAELFVRRSGNAQSVQFGQQFELSSDESEMFREVFWDLFRQGVITLGLNDSNSEFPFFKVSQFGARIMQNQNAYFFHDVSSYSHLVQTNIPSIDQVTLLYLQEAMQAFKSGCILSATVMLGVATEHSFLLLLEDIEHNPKHEPTFRSVFKEKTILSKVNKFKHILDQSLNALPPDIKEDLDTHFAGILSIIRTFRNQSGHPTGKIVDREQAYILLQLFVPYCKKIYQLRDYFRK